MKTKELIKKYEDAVKSVATANGVDMGVGLDMLRHEYWASKGMYNRQHRYNGVPKGFDFEAFGKDL